MSNSIELEYNYEPEELNAITNCLALIRAELAEVLEEEQIMEMVHSPYDVCMNALSFIKNAKQIRKQDLESSEGKEITV